MSKYKVLKVFVDTHTKKTYRIGQEVEFSEERFQEAEEKLKAFGGGYLELIEKSEEQQEQEEQEQKEQKDKQTTTKKQTKRKG